jgi:hypothetical protein
MKPSFNPPSRSVRFTTVEEAATQAVLSLAAGMLEQAGYAAFVRENLRYD